MKLTRTQLQNLLIEQVIFSEGLRYHVENSIPLYDCIYRPGSKGFFSLISESRTMYNNGLLRVDEDELDMLNSDLGEFAVYEGREVALDFPISEQADYELQQIHLSEGIFDFLSSSPQLTPEQQEEKEYLDFYSIPVTNPKARRNYLKMLFDDPRQAKVWLDYYNQVWKPQHVNKLLKKKLDKKNLDQIDERKKRRKRKKSKAKKSGSYYKGRKVKLNKPQRNSGSGGKFVVYVRNQKTGNIKRITFGARGMTTGLRSPARRKSFAARHRCAQKKDKLAPGYWACRIGRYPAVSGAPYTTWW